jgi:hypothetical protein
LGGEDTLNEQLKQHVGMEESAVIGVKKGMSPEDRKALDILENNTIFTEDRYEVAMLWKSPDAWLPCNKMAAENRMKSLRRKLVNNPDIHQKYSEFMGKLLEKGHAQKLSPEESEVHGQRTWFLPHHSVVHPQKPEKVCAVFDAAAKTDGVSLNSQLMQGPDFINSLLGVLLRFREYPTVIVGDIPAGKRPS